MQAPADGQYTAVAGRHLPKQVDVQMTANPEQAFSIISSRLRRVCATWACTGAIEAVVPELADRLAVLVLARAALAVVRAVVGVSAARVAKTAVPLLAAARDVVLHLLPKLLLKLLSRELLHERPEENSPPRPARLIVLFWVTQRDDGRDSQHRQRGQRGHAAPAAAPVSYTHLRLPTKA